MTQMQINYHTLEEQKRSNAAREYETGRSNLAQEREAHRSNVARENENYRSNVAKERENYRSNTAKERENLRSNYARERETYRSNKASEENARIKANADLLKGQAYAKNADTKVKEYLIQEELLPYTKAEKGTKVGQGAVDILSKIAGVIGASTSGFGSDASGLG